jgi:uncharacterized repeat protein (TIGR04138 family)
MVESTHPIALLLKEDRRYKFEAYALVFESLNYAHKELGMGSDPPAVTEEEDTQAERHLTGQQLCEAIRRYALEQYGLMAETVLKNWGITSTSDFGEIVFNLIRIGQMRKTPSDKREDFDNVYDFRDGFAKEFRITLPTSD